MESDNEYKITWVGLLIIKNRKILMTREKGKDLFQLPGGGQDGDEGYEDTLRRELKEELGVEIINPKVYDDFVLPGRNEDVKIRFIIYKADVLGKIIKGKEIEEIKYIDSKYEEKRIDIGNPAKIKLIPRLLIEDIID